MKMAEASKKSKALDIYPLSPLQEGMLFQHLHHGGEGDHVTQGMLPLTGHVEVDLLQLAFQYLVDRHDVLRTIFLHDGVKKPRQVVVDQRMAKVRFVDLTDAVANSWNPAVLAGNNNCIQANCSDVDIEAIVEEIADFDQAKGFDLKKDLLVRMTLVKTSINAYRLIITNHHIVLDGWSLSVLLEELLEFYWAAKTDHRPELTPVVQFKHYIKWVSGSDTDEGYAFFKLMLEGFGNPTGIPRKTWYVDQLGQTNPTSTTVVSFDYDFGEAKTTALERMCRSHQITTNSAIQALWALVLQCFTGSNDVVFGNVVSGRSPEVKGIERMVGMMINTLPLRVKVEANCEFITLAQSLQNESKALEKLSFLQLAEIQKRVRHNENLFDHVVTFENYPIMEELLAGKYSDIGFTIPSRSGRDLTSFDLNVTFFPGRSLVLNLLYNSALYSEDAIASVAHTMNHLLDQLLVRPDIRCGEFCWTNDTAVSELTAQLVLGLNRSIDSRLAAIVKAKNLITFTTCDQLGRPLPSWALGTLWARALESNLTDLPFGAILQQSTANTKVILLVGDNARHIERLGFSFAPEIIENCALADPSVQQCALVTDAGSQTADQSLYWVPRGEQPTADVVARLSSLLASRFPHFMLPKDYRQASDITFTESGTEVVHGASFAVAEYLIQEADDSVETTLATLWQEILGVDKVGEQDDFFLCGGHSLLVIRFISRAKKLFEYSLTTDDMFSIRCFGGLVNKIRSNVANNVRAERGIAGVPMETAVAKPYYPVSSQQQRLYSLQALDPSGLAYNMPDAFNLFGPVDIERLAQAFELTIEKHEALRTSFHLEQNSVVQCIHPQSEFQLRISDIDPTATATELMQGFIKPFLLDQPALVRASLYRQSNDKSILLLDMHHIVTDGVSIDLLVNDLVMAYHQQALEPVQFQYKDYCEFLQNKQVRTLLEQQKQFWLQTFDGEIPVLNLPTDFPRKPEFRYSAAQHQFELGPERSRQVGAFCQTFKITPYMFFMAAYQVLLARYANQTEVVIGTPIAGRNHPDTDAVVGMFVNTLAIKQTLDTNLSFADFIGRVKATVLGALNHQNFPMEDLITALNPSRDLSRNALFDVLFVLEDKQQTIPRFDDLRFELVEYQNHSAKFDLLLAVLDDPSNYSIHIEFAAELFAHATIVQLAEHFVQIVDIVMANPAVQLGDIEILSTTEIAQQVNEFNCTWTESSAYTNIAQAFESIVARSRHDRALVFQGRSLSFDQLNELSNKMAHWLVQRNIGRGSVIALMMTKSLDMIAAIYGVLKAGAAYVPVGADYPQERINTMLDELDVPLVIFNRDLSETLEGLELRCASVNFDSIQEEASAGHLHDLQVAVRPDDLAYVIYTSGSTGKPKGIMIEHRSILNLMTYFSGIFGPGDQVTQFAPFTFDASAGEILCTLLNGACLHVLPHETIADPVKYAHYLGENGITFTALPPPYLVNVDFSQADKLHTLLAAGSSSNPEIIEKLKTQLVYINAYGPTETTVISTEWRSDRDDTLKNCIGRPILNTTVYILNTHGKLQPIGVEGEICIGGLGVARGYVKDPSRTASQFIENPYRNKEIIYRSGDMGKLTPDGEIIFLGRKDDQVKIRGFRIEIAEVEQQVKELSIIDDAHVIAFNDKSGNLALCCYFTSSVLTADSFDHEVLRNELRRFIPEYMLPAYLVLLEALPLTANGKVDRKQLPAPEQRSSNRKVEAARTKVETLLLHAWQQVLGNDEMGITDNFFALGGDSIKAIQIAARLNGLGYKLDVARVFQNPRIQDLAAFVEKSGIQIEQGVVHGIQKLTPIQKWFFDKSFTDAHHWNQSSVLFRSNGFDVGLVRETLNALLKQHDNLRAVPSGNTSEMVVSAGSFYQGDIHVVDSNTACLDRDMLLLGQQVQCSMTLSQGPLMRAGVVTTEGGDYLLIVIHHLLVDGVSWRILYDDFCSVYNALLQKLPVHLPLKTHSFKQWATGLDNYASTDALLLQLEYWRAICQPDGLLWIADGSVTDREILANTRHLNMEFDESLTRDLLEKANAAFFTNANDLLLTAFARAMAKVFGKTDFLLNLEGHGRENVCPGLDVSRTVGWFTSAFPVRLKADCEMPLAQLICAIKENLHRIPDHGLGYGVLRFVSSENNPEVSKLQLQCEPEISFNYLGDFTGSGGQSDIAIASLNAGPEMSLSSEALCALNINGSVVDGRLCFDFEYAPKLLSSEIAVNIMREFREGLIEIVEFCSACEIPEHTPSDFAAAGLTEKDLAVIHNVFSWADIEDIHNLTPLQEGMLYSCVLNAGRGDYNIQNDIFVRGELDHTKLAAAFSILTERHQALRTAIMHDNLSRPRQVVLCRRELTFSQFDISDLNTVAQQNYIADIQSEEWSRGFDLATDSLTRVVLLKTAYRENHLLMISHHIMMDGWCIGAVFAELLTIYQALVDDSQVVLEQAPAYTDYLNWLQKQNRAAALNFWQKYLADFESSGSLPFMVSNSVPDYQLEDELLILDSGKTEQLSQLAAAQGLTLNSIAQALWALLLASYTNSNDVIFANVISGRPSDLVNVEKTIGLFVNTIPVRVQIDKHQSFCELAAAIQSAFKQSEVNGYVGLAEIRDLAALPANVFDHVFVFENFPIGQFEGEDAVKGLEIQTQTGKEQVNYDFNIILAPGDEFSIRFSYNQNSISSTNVRRIKSHFLALIDGVLTYEQTTCANLAVLCEQDTQAWHKLNATEVAYNQEQTLINIIYEQVVSTPYTTALTCGEINFTYIQLWHSAGEVAAHLISNCQVEPGSVIALVLKRGHSMVSGLLGILRAGCAYLPVDPELPEDRVNYMLSNAGVETVVTDTLKALPAYLQESSYQCIEIDRFVDSPAHAGAIDNPFYASDVVLPVSTCTDLAYVLYTSGSTGKPKGVMIEHRSVVNRLLWMISEFGFVSDDVFLQKTAITFDVSVFELLVPFMCGGSLVMLQVGGEKDPQAIVDTVNSRRVSVIHFVPSMLSGFLHAFDKPINARSLRLCVCSGEALTEDHRDHFYRQLPETLLANLYGPTEAAIDVTYQKVEPETTEVTIGTPIANTQCYILDTLDRLSPVGIKGELCLAGVQLARGYINSPLLTSERFVFHQGLSKRLYRTGDVAQLGEDGNIHYIGRADFQVKIRGYRIELGEIEKNISIMEGIKDVLVTAVELNDGTQALCAYYTEVNRVSKEQIKTHLASILPDYMIPSFIILLLEFPLNASGKINRKMLPNPVNDADYNKPKDERPLTEMEHFVERIWCQVLLANHTIEHNYLPVNCTFEQLGGHSINAMRVCALLSRELNITLPVASLYRFSSIRSLASHLEDLADLKNEKFSNENVKRVKLQTTNIEHQLTAVMLQWSTYEACITQPILAGNSSTFEFSPIQSLHVMQPNRLSGGAVDFDFCQNTQVLQIAIQQFIYSQQLLMSNYCRGQGISGWLWQTADNPKVSDIPFLDLSCFSQSDADLLLNDLIDRVSKQLSEQIAKPSPSNIPYMMFLIKFNGGRHRLLFGADHLITDASTLEVIESCVTQQYLNLVTGEGNKLSVASQNKIKYQNYVEAVRKGPLVNPESYQKSLLEFSKKQQIWLNFYHEHATTMTQKFGFTREFDSEVFSPVEAALQIFVDIVKACTELKDIPLTVVTDQRKHLDNHYFQVVGEFLDQVPLLCNELGDAKDWLAKAHQFIAQAGKDNLNFMALAENLSLPFEWQAVAKTLYNDAANLKLIRFNYQGENATTLNLSRGEHELTTSDATLNGIFCEVTSSFNQLFFNIETNISISSEFINAFLKDLSVAEEVQSHSINQIISDEGLNLL